MRTNLHDALHVAPDLGGVQVALGVAHHVQPLDGVVPSILGQLLVRLVGLHLLSCGTHTSEYQHRYPSSGPCTQPHGDQDYAKRPYIPTSRMSVSGKGNSCKADLLQVTMQGRQQDDPQDEAEAAMPLPGKSAGMQKPHRLLLTLSKREKTKRERQQNTVKESAAKQGVWC